MRRKIVGIVILMLVATTLVSATNINVKEDNNKIVNAEPTEPGLFEWWNVDQKQTHHDGYGSQQLPNYYDAQSFTPTKDKLTAVSLYFFRYSTPPEPVHITVSIRDNLTSSDLATKTIDTSLVTIENATWVLFDFEDISITPGNKYYIVCSADAGDLTHAYCWFFSSNETYNRGEPWYKIGDDSWKVFTSIGGDYCFKTYFRKPLDVSSVPQTIPSNPRASITEAIISSCNSEKESRIAPLQSNAVVWSKTYGGSEFDELRDVEQTTDGGYIACGETEVSNNFYPWVLKVDAAGDEEWNWTLTQVTYNGTIYELIDMSYVNCIHQISDGGYVVGLQIAFMSDTEEYAFGSLAKLNETGIEEWVQIYGIGFSWTFWPNSFSIVDDGYIIAGDAGDPVFTGSTDYDTGLLKTNTNGVEQWHHVWDFGPFSDYCWAVCQTNDNGYFCTGYYLVTSSIGRSFMIKTDANGNEQWNKTFGGTKGDYIQSRNCYQTPDNGYIVGGYTYSYGLGSSDSWIVKTDSSGTLSWNKTYGDKSRDSCFSIEKTNDGGYVICNTNNWSASSGDKEDTFLIKIDSSGNTRWVQEFGGPGRQVGEDVNGTNDGGFIVSGRTGIYQDATSDAFLTKFAPIDMTIDIKGGLGIQTTIKNNGIADLTNVSYKVNVKGGILGLINKTISGWINVSAGETLPFDKIMVFGLGPITITAKVADEEQIVTGTQLIIFSVVKK